jgi:serine/threonine protein phosphatase 1
MFWPVDARSTTRPLLYRQCNRVADGLAVVGDLHGEASKLARALNWLVRSDRHLIFLGDYVNRGPDSRAVLEMLCSLKTSSSSSLTLLRGNHEEALLRFLDGGGMAEFAAYGGLTTIHSYCPTPSEHVVSEFRASFPTNHLELIASTAAFFEQPGLLATHCGFDPARPTARDGPSVVMGDFPELFRLVPDASWPLTVFGHYVQRTGQPYVSDRLICLDTGCGTYHGAPLSVLLLPELTVVAF